MVKNKWYRGVPAFSGSQHVWEGARIEAGRVGAGDWMLHVQACGMVPTSATGWSHEPLIQRVEIPIAIRPGETTVVELP